MVVGSPKCSTCWSTGSGARPVKVSPGSSSTGSRLACATPAAVTMLSAPGADRGGRGHDLAAVRGPGVGDRGERHALLVLAAPGRQLVAHLVQRGAEPEDVAVAEDREDAGEQRHLGAVEQLGALGGHPPHQRLGGGQPDGGRRVIGPVSGWSRSPPSRRRGHRAAGVRGHVRPGVADPAVGRVVAEGQLAVRARAGHHVQVVHRVARGRHARSVVAVRHQHDVVVADQHVLVDRGQPGRLVLGTGVRRVVAEPVADGVTGRRRRSGSSRSPR